MYANFPSAEATTSCGSGPEGTCPTTLSVTGLTINKARSPLESTSRAVDGVSAAFSNATLTKERKKRARTNVRLLVMYFSLLKAASSKVRKNPDLCDEAAGSTKLSQGWYHRQQPVVRTPRPVKWGTGT